MKALWIVVILLALALVLVFFRYESTRTRVAELDAWKENAHGYLMELSVWSDSVEAWGTVLSKEFWDLRNFVCDQHDGCTDPDKRGEPPDPPPDYP